MVSPCRISRKTKTFTSIWEDGVWLGIINEAGESVIGTEIGAIQAKDFRRKTIQAERWNTNTVDKLKGTPWEPTPGRTGDFSIKPRLFIPL